MKDIDPGEMEYLLQFVYLGEVDIPSLELERLIAISKDLGNIRLDSFKKEEDLIYDNVPETNDQQHPFDEKSESHNFL